MRYLTIALTKGRLAYQTLELLEKVGITCDEMKNKDTRKLIFTDEEHKLLFPRQLTYPGLAPPNGPGGPAFGVSGAGV